MNVMTTSMVSDLVGEPSMQEVEKLFREHYQLIYRTAYAITGRAEDAEDVLQTVFLRLVRRRTSPDLQQNAKGYLYRAAVNASLDTLEARRRHALAEETDRLESASVAIPIDSDSIDNQRLSRALSKLRPRAVEMLILRYGHDYSDAEIAKMMGTSRGVIAVTLYRARARLKKILHSIKDGKS
jgi:RNA polymerase sigma-70 factor (ECF subfamily)